MKVDGQDLDPLQVPFPEPLKLYQSTALHTNPQGHVFELTASGDNPEYVSRFTQETRLAFQIVPGAFDRGNTAQQSQYQQSEPETSETGQTPHGGVSMKINVVDTAGIQPPYHVKFVIDPFIDEQSTGWHTYTYTAMNIWVDVRADDGTIVARLMKNSVTEDGPVQVDSNSGTEVPALRSLDGSSGDQRSATFHVRISGTGTYTLSGSYS